ncbi:hypothetical protein JHK86_010741 [Glycine max]|nr:hypothetical protein JHK86_010741 [Glycine max]
MLLKARPRRFQSVEEKSSSEMTQNKRSSTPKTAMQEQDSFPWMKFRNKCIAAAGGAHMMSERETISYTRLKSFLHKDTSFHSPWSWEPNVPMLLLRIMKLQVHQEE